MKVDYIKVIVHTKTVLNETVKSKPQLNRTNNSVYAIMKITPPAAANYVAPQECCGIE